ncbi:undecaprenyldiphospho-muramoylpentapeptide beta-N-acetylglucosaminyltransferase [Shewanella sp. JM162201]|uniref:UDP-N-acetylglucosamine--N-acetylmuramyl-(pentapeptide) pyrophosphoryl-undecaprenol N-acetylglucosamine transferase n=1 Tax=Shewanella jiangmenensis TaxID=2837387 RepID=A0ABS5V7V6_9GAMM|nr:undecaprenyldiphospho-muramoylpentapeptide beta-N-acetylglucosaminyltransferase [Shewanella jiangmenensis]MBT1446505.1 undecaprenyldiphospho-muramoylpentapeptide beta-N-acetylglucosaminyltransferase [Shewanella jiangmenensis]
MGPRNGKKLLVMAGGTGGHVFPALAVARKLAAEGWQVRWLGTADRMEARLVPQHGFDIDFIDIQGVRGNGLLRKLAAPVKILRSVLQARGVIQSFKPDVVLGMGGFASGPGGVAARLCGIPLVLHEQNAIAGMTNKILSRIASRVLCAFEGAFGTAGETVGNPIREELVALGGAERETRTEALKVLVVGGSLGAKVFNDLMPKVTSQLAKEQPVVVWHQTGRGNLDAVQQAYQELGQDGAVQVAEFIDDMEAAYRWADVVLCRSGALTVSELAAVGLPSILVPYPLAVDDHQTMNAKVLVDAGAAFLVPQPIATAELVADKLRLLGNDREELARMGKRARAAAVLDATEQVAGVCRELAE